jgi:hypothetical protein
MAVTQSALAHAMARDLLRVAPPEADIKRVWVWSQHGHIDPERDYVELAVMHGPLNDETFQRFLAAVADMMNDCYPEANKLLQTFSSVDVGQHDLGDVLRPGSEEVDLSGE